MSSMGTLPFGSFARSLQTTSLARSTISRASGDSGSANGWLVKYSCLIAVWVASVPGPKTATVKWKTRTRIATVWPRAHRTQALSP